MSNLVSQSTIEGQVIGAILSHPGALHRCTTLNEDSFTDQTYRTLWRLVTDCRSAGYEPAPAAIALRYAQQIDNLGGVDFLNRLAAHGEDILPVFTEAVDRLQESHQWRRLQTLNARLSSAIESREKSPNDILSGVVKVATGHLSASRGDSETKRSVARRAIMNAIADRDVTTTGLHSLDMMMQGGIQSARLYGIAGEFGIGKTILAGTISDNFNLQGIPHLYITLETEPSDIELRICARHLNLNVAALHDKGDEDHPQFVANAEAYLDRMPANVEYDYSPMATIDELHRKILAAKAQHGIKGFIIDYWQLIRGKQRGQSDNAHLCEVADRLAAICRQEKLWGIVMAQCEENGRLRVSDGLHQSCSLLLRLVREQGQSSAYFVTFKSNYTAFYHGGNESFQNLVFDQEVGPHFRDVISTDSDVLSDDGAIDV